MTGISFKGGGFFDLAHKLAFERERARVRFGGPDQRRCGALTRSGHICQKTPLAGEFRCLAHGGPALARRYRAAQLEALRKGELSQAEFDRAEAKRAANRLRDRWKRDPWVPGATLDLGEHEDAFLRDLGYCGFDVDTLPPAVADTARWRWRRFCLDRPRYQEWASFCSEDLPRRVRLAGGQGRRNGAEVQFDRSAAFSVGTPPNAYSKRQRPDQPRTRETVPDTRTRKRRVPDTTEIDAATLASVLANHGDVVRRVTGEDGSEADLIWVAMMLARVLAAPEDAEAANEWREMVTRQRFG